MVDTTTSPGLAVEIKQQYGSVTKKKKKGTAMATATKDIPNKAAPATPASKTKPAPAWLAKRNGKGK